MKFCIIYLFENKLCNIPYLKTIYLRKLHFVELSWYYIFPYIKNLYCVFDKKGFSYFSLSYFRLKSLRRELSRFSAFHILKNMVYFIYF